MKIKEATIKRTKKGFQIFHAPEKVHTIDLIDFLMQATMSLVNDIHKEYIKAKKDVKNG